MSEELPSLVPPGAVDVNSVSEMTEDYNFNDPDQLGGGEMGPSPTSSRTKTIYDNINRRITVLTGVCKTGSWRRGREQQNNGGPWQSSPQGQGQSTGGESKPSESTSSTSASASASGAGVGGVSSVLHSRSDGAATQDGRDLFGASSLAKHRGFEPVCGQAWVQDEDQAGGVVGTRSSGQSQASRKGEDKEAVRPVARYCDMLLRLKTVQCFMLFLTLGILYLGDFFQATLEVGFDGVHKVILWVCLVFFSLEWILSILASPVQTPPYNCSLFFFLDALATISIAIDIFMLSANNLAENGPIARAARAARIGTRAGRSMRLLRLTRFLRLVRIARFVKALLMHRDNVRKSRRRSEEWDAAAGTLNDSSMTRADTIGAQIGATTTRKVVIMTLMLLIVLPLLERNTSFHTCNAELAVMLETIYNSPEVQGNCARMQNEIGAWFNSGVVPFSQDEETGLTKNGMIYAQIHRCIIYTDRDLMGEANLLQTRLAKQRRGTEIQVIPCDAVFTNIYQRDTDERSDTYMLYDMQDEEQESAKYAMGFTTVVIVTLLGFSLIFSQDAEVLANELVVPIGQLMENMSYTSRLELDKVTPEEELFESNVYEVRKLQVAYLNLNGAVGSFAKFTPLEVVRHFLSLGTEAKLGVAQRNVSIFFSDIAGFTTICEGTSPMQVLALLSEYFESMVSIIVEEKGTMLEFIGDAILAVWNAPNTVDDHAVRAVTSALRMNLVLVELRQKWLEQGKPNIRIRVGLHSADVFVGNLGSKMRMKYGVLGDGVNLASRLEELNKRYQTEILVSEDVTLQPDIKDTFYLRPVDCVVVKGRQKPTALYEVLSFKEGASDQTKQIAAFGEQAMKCYMQRDFGQALMCLDQVLQLKDSGQDPAGEVLADRCRHFLEFPPPAEWDGSEVLTEKTFGNEG